MAAPGTVFYKSSGDLLSGGNGNGPWTPVGVNSYVDKLVRLYHQRENIDLAGIVTVTGAGNIVRGQELEECGLAPRYKDAIGLC
jgi:uridylate kinase